MSNDDQDVDQNQPNFEELFTLAKDNPELFEAKRLEYIEHFFTKVPAEKQRRLRGLQWQIDQARNLARTPMSSCLHIMNMMWNSLSRLNDQQRILVQITSPGLKEISPSQPYTSESADTTNDSKVIPFPTR